jgi:hypothetical protein
MTEEKLETDVPNVIELQLSDMIDMVNIIDLCSQRGAFQGEEMEIVGKLRNKIKQFVSVYDPPEDLFVSDESETHDEPTNETNEENI